MLAATLSWAHASTVLIQAPQSQTLEYRSALRAHGDYVSPTKHYLGAHPSSAARESLLVLFAAAQKAFLEVSNGDARIKFVQVLELLPRDDWAGSDREIFLQVYLRLAQLESDAGARDRWLGLSLLLGGGLKYDASLFPPPLLARRSELAQQLPKVKISLRGLNSGWSQVLINGERCEKMECGTWSNYPGPVRVTYLSDQWIAQTLNLEISEIEKYSPAVTAWAEGSCAQSQFHRRADEFASKKLFFSAECDRSALASLDLKPVVPSPDEISRIPTPVKKSSSFYESKWFWAGVGTLVAVLIVRGQQSHENKQTTTTYGY